MTRLRTMILVILAVEAVGAALAVAARLNSTHVVPPPVERYNDSLTGSELAALPGGYLFDGYEKWKSLGETYLATGYFAKAEACWRQAARARPAAPEPVFQRALCLERLGQVERAGEEYRRVAEAAPAALARRAWHRAGRIDLRREQPEAADRAFAAAGESYWPSVYHRAQMRLRDGRLDDAAPLIHRLAQAHPDDLRVWQLRAQLAAKEGQTPDRQAAEDAAERVGTTLVLDDAERDLKPIRRRFGLVRQFARVGAAATADEQVAAAVQLAEGLLNDPLWQNGSLLAVQDVATMLLQAGRTVLAERLVARQLTEQRLPTAVCLEQSGDLAAARGESDAADDAWTRSSRLTPRASVERKLARLARERGDEAAARLLDQSARRLEALEQFHSQDWESSRETWQSLVAESPEDVGAWYCLGEVERLRGDAAAAREALDRCLALDPAHGRAAAARARLGQKPP